MARSGTLRQKVHVPGQLVGAAADVFAMGTVLRLLLADVAVKTSMRSDLDAVVDRALATGPEQRYGSVADFAADLQRCLDRRPVVARGHSAWYRSARWAQRHPHLLVIASAALVSIVLALELLAAQSGRLADRQRGDLLRERLIGTVIPMVSSVQLPEQRKLETLTAQLEQGVYELDDELVLREAVSEGWAGLGRYDRALAACDRTIALSTSHHGAEHEVSLRLRCLRELLVLQFGDRQTSSEAVAIARAQADSDDPRTRTAARLVIALTEMPTADGPRALELAADVHRGTPSGLPRTASTCLLAWSMCERGLYEEAATILEAAEAVAPGDPGVLQGLAACALLRGDLPRARQLSSEVTPKIEGQLGPGHLLSLRARQIEAVAAQAAGDEAACGSILQMTLEQSVRSLGADHPETMRLQLSLARSRISCAALRRSPRADCPGCDDGASASHRRPPRHRPGRGRPGDRAL